MIEIYFNTVEYVGHGYDTAPWVQESLEITVTDNLNYKDKKRVLWLLWPVIGHDQLDQFLQNSIFYRDQWPIDQIFINHDKCESSWTRPKSHKTKIIFLYRPIKLYNRITVYIIPALHRNQHMELSHQMCIFVSFNFFSK